MKENKNIDQLFKDKFDNHEVTPPEFIWENIEEKLQKKKKRRVIPFWWYGSGVAALFVIGLFIFNKNYTLEIHPKNNVVLEENTKDSINSEIQNNSENTIIKSEKNNIVSSEKKLDSDASSSDKKEIFKNNSGVNKNSVVNNASSYNSSEKNNTNSSSKTAREQIIQEHKKAVENTNNAIVENTKENNNTNIQKNKISEKEIIKNNEKVAQNNLDLIEKKSEGNKENNIDLGKIAMNNQNNVATKGEVNTPKDSTAIATVETNELEELLKEKETQITQEQKVNRWQVTPNLAPIYFGSFDSGSPLDPNLDDNTKSFNDNMSYGVAVNYAVNSKLKIRTGINAVTVDFNTNDIAFFQSTNARMMKNVEPTAEGSLIEIVPIKNVNLSFNRLETEQGSGVLNQKMGFIEMPMEVSYTLYDKKLGVEIIGGMSTMFLNKNEIYLEADGVKMKIGEASNLNSMHLSTNFGVGLNYGFLKNFQARLEPTFKYQLNTFSRDSQNFKPYIFGIYTGISYKF